MDNFHRTTFLLIYISGPNKCIVSHVYISPLSELESFKYSQRLLLAPENGENVALAFFQIKLLSGRINVLFVAAFSARKRENVELAFFQIELLSEAAFSARKKRGEKKLFLYVASGLTQPLKLWR